MASKGYPETLLRGTKADGTTLPVLVDEDGNLQISDTANVTISVVGGQLVKASANFTRPNNNTQYTAGDEVSNNASQGSAVALNFPNVVAANGETGYVVKGILKVTGITAPASPTNALYRLLLFDTLPTMVGDNAPLLLTDALAAHLTCYVDFAAITGPGNSTALYCLDDGLRTAFKCDAADVDLYGILTAQAGYSPILNSTWTIDLLLERA